MKPKSEPENIEDLLRKKKKKKKEEQWEIDDSDFPVHEKYTEEEPVKK